MLEIVPSVIGLIVYQMLGVTCLRVSIGGKSTQKRDLKRALPQFM
jgi:hypothetical protein